MRILVLDGGHKNALAILRHLSRQKVGELYVQMHTRYAYCYFSLAPDKKIFGPQARDGADEFIEFLLPVLEREQIDLVIPVGYYSCQACANHADEIREYSRLIIADGDKVALAANKAEISRLASTLGIPVPQTIELESEEAIETLDPDFPVVIKAPIESTATTTLFARNREEMIQSFNEMVRSLDLSAPNLPFVQEKVVGHGAGFFAYYEKGVCKRFFMHRRIREFPVDGGASVCAKSFRDPELERLGRTLLDALEWEGVAMVEFKHDDSTNQYKLLEINPKFWGSLDLALTAGVNFPGFLVQRAQGVEVSPGGDYADYRFQWLLNGEAYHFFENPRALPAILRDLFRSKNDIWITDPFVIIVQLVKIVEYWYKRFRR